ncbi:hypothetical protein PTKIN_Ptkin12aG0099300 [Pterospermum kingtungense]
METLLSHDGTDGRDIYGTIKPGSTEHQKESAKGFTFAEVGCIQNRNSKVTCCYFSSDGKLLASVGHDKKVVLWNMDTLQTESTPEEHNMVITDIRFRPNSSQLATASVDKSVRLWDAANPSYCVQAYSGHTSPVMSLDFHPKKTDLFGFCDNDNEIRYGNLNTFSCTRISKVAFYFEYLSFIPDAGIKCLELWNMAENKSMTISAHENIISALSQSPVTGMVASATHDSSVKLWE